MKLLRLLIIVLAMALVAAACSSDDGSSDTASEGTSAQAADGDATTTTESDDDAGSDVTIDSLPDTPIGNIPGVSSECEALANLVFGMTQLIIGGDSDQLLAAAESGLPSSLDDEIATILEGANQYGDALGDLEIDFSDPSSLAALTPEELAQLEAASEAIDTDAFNSALDAVSAYAETECDQFAGG